MRSATILNCALWALIIWGISHAVAEDACGMPKNNDLDAVVSRCLAKSPRLRNTELSPEARDRFFIACGFQSGIWKRCDP